MRIFTFGCSFTQYAWPTWADILINENICNGGIGENWGRCGAGNQYIATKIWECNARNKFTADDLIFICWTHFDREDRYVYNKGWINPNLGVDHYDKSFVRNYNNSKHFAMRDLMLIKSTQLALTQLNLVHTHWTIHPYEHQNNPSAMFQTYDEIYKIIDMFDLKFDAPPMMAALDILNVESIDARIQTAWGNDRDANTDYHPYPWEHLEFINSHLLKFIKNELSPTTLEFVERWKEKILSMPNPIVLPNLKWQHISPKTQW